MLKTFLIVKKRFKDSYKLKKVYTLITNSTNNKVILKKGFIHTGLILKTNNNFFFYINVLARNVCNLTGPTSINNRLRLVEFVELLNTKSKHFLEKKINYIKIHSNSIEKFKEYLNLLTGYLIIKYSGVYKKYFYFKKNGSIKKNRYKIFLKNNKFIWNLYI